jgi:hypothetical protein
VKYVDMQRAALAQRYQEAKDGAPAKTEPVHKPAPRAASQTPVPFRLFRAGDRYAGQVTLPDGRSFLIDAEVVQDLSGQRGFEGTVHPCGATKLLKGAKVTGQPPPGLNLTGSPAEDFPFNDPIPF